MERVNPVDLTSNFASILSEPIIASNVVAKIKLHKGLQFRNELNSNLSEDKSLLTKDIGNVTADTEITFEYTLKKISELVKMDDIDLTSLKNFSFQTQITYKALDGSKCIRVITEKQDISSEREDLEKNANFEVLGHNAIMQSANMARMGNHRGAQAYAKNWNRKMKINAESEEQQMQRDEFIENFKGLYDCIGEQNNKEQMLVPLGGVQEKWDESEESDAEMEAEEEKKPESSGFFSGIKSMLTKKDKKKKKAPKVQPPGNMMIQPASMAMAMP